MIRQTISDVVLSIHETCMNETAFAKGEDAVRLPNRGEIIGLIKDLRRVIFPGYFGEEHLSDVVPDYFLGNMLTDIYRRLSTQIEMALMYRMKGSAEEATVKAEAGRICNAFIGKIPEIQKALLMDVQAAFDGDPAADSKEDIIFSYPGLFAIYVYRMAHELYLMKVPFIPRIMTEYAHNKTGIDINPGATIGHYFCIDHGTGIVIGETTRIGDYVKLYQGVTLGALSTRKGQALSGTMRHPTIESYVTIYAGSTILGGDTVIGEGSVSGGNTFITDSVPPYSRVSMKAPELTISSSRKKEDVWD